MELLPGPAEPRRAAPAAAGAGGTTAAQREAGSQRATPVTEGGEEISRPLISVFLDLIPNAMLLVSRNANDAIELF